MSRKRSKAGRGDTRPEDAGGSAGGADAVAEEASDGGLPEDDGEGDGDGDDDLAPRDPAVLKRVVESLVFASDRPLTLARLRQLTHVEDAKRLRAALDELVAEYASRGIVLHEVAGGYQFRTSPATAEYVQQLVAGRPVRLSRAQLETLAIIAYRQPITRPEIDDIRGVDSGGTLRVLLERSLIRVLGKKEEPGRPLLYGTTKDFLEFFNLGELRDLPTLREYHELTEESIREVQKQGHELDLSDLKDAAQRAMGPDHPGADGDGDEPGDGAASGPETAAEAAPAAAEGRDGDSDPEEPASTPV